METGDIRKRLRHTIDAAKRAAGERRARVADAERDGERVLTQTVAPLFTTIASALKAEGYAFRLSTPAGGVRLALETSADDFIELTLDTGADPPAIVGRMQRTWGRRVLADERVVRDGAAIGALTAEDALGYVLSVLPRFVER